jgi:hypothetical protein
MTTPARRPIRTDFTIEVSGSTRQSSAVVGRGAGLGNSLRTSHCGHCRMIDQCCDQTARHLDGRGDLSPSMLRRKEERWPTALTSDGSRSSSGG